MEIAQFNKITLFLNHQKMHKIHLKDIKHYNKYKLINKLYKKKKKKFNILISFKSKEINQNRKLKMQKYNNYKIKIKEK